MMTDTQHPLVTRYLKDLERALRDVPSNRRHEIVNDIKGHIAEAAAERGGEMTEAELRSLLDQVGHPETIAEEARERFGIPRKRAGAMEGIAIAGLLIGGLIVPALGWVLGVVLLWASSAWNTRDKVLGTLVIPGGLAAPVFYMLTAVSSQTCIAPSNAGCGEAAELVGQGVLVVLVVSPILVAIYLGRKAFRR